MPAPTLEQLYTPRSAGSEGISGPALSVALERMFKPAPRVRPEVVNRHHFHGRSLPAPWVYIGRGTPLGNPFTAVEHGPDTLVLYRQHLTAAIERHDPEVLAALNAISPAHSLVCSCVPRPCHGDVVVEAWEWLAGKGEW